MKNLLVLFFIIILPSFAEEPKFTHESELGYISAKGNSDQQTFNLATRNSSPMGDYFLNLAAITPQVLPRMSKTLKIGI